MRYIGILKARSDGVVFFLTDPLLYVIVYLKVFLYVILNDRS